MNRPVPVVLSVVTALALLLAGCGGHSDPSAPPPVKNPFAYDQSRPLDAQVDATVDQGPVKVHSLSYVTFDGTRVPALFAVPRHGPVHGCLMYQPGVGQGKEVAAPLWPGAAKLGLAMFTIDVRDTGARAKGSASLEQVLSSPTAIRTLLRDDVRDLRRGLDYLERQPECRHNVGYLGTSEGAILGTLFSGVDTRIRAAVLTSVGATWRARLFYSPYILPGIIKNPGAMQTALEVLSPYNTARWIARIAPRPVMIVDGLRDPSIPPIDALALANAARQPKTLLLHPGGHDPFAGPQGQQVADKVGAFLKAHLVEHR